MQNATSTTTIPTCMPITAHDGTVLCSWSDNPNFRGTLNILWLCVSTLGLCVWNAVHPDVPYPGTPKWRVTGKRIWWLFVGLFMPEMLVLVALGQFLLAYRLLVRVSRETAVPTEFPWWMRLIERFWSPPLPEREILPTFGPASPSPRASVHVTAQPSPDLELDSMAPLLPVHASQASIPRTLPEASEDVLMRDTPEAQRNLLPVRASQTSLPGPLPEASEHASMHDAPQADGQESLLPVRASQTLLRGTLPQDKEDALTREAPEAPESARIHPWTLTHSFYAVMHGFVSADGDAFYTTGEDGEPVFSLDDSVRCISAADGYPHITPDLSADDLNDRSKSGSLAKGLLVWQFSVFIVNCSARWNQNLPLSLLEITTIAHSFCSLIALALWWYKPHSIGEAIVIDRARSLPPPRKADWITTVLRAIEKVLPTNRDFGIPETVVILGIAALYGLPHLLGLSVHFPTSAEQRCWQIATGTVIGLPIVSCLILWDMELDLTENLGRIAKIVETVRNSLLFLLIILYPIASMFLVGESVRQVFALPEGSFQEPQLTRYLPNFS